MQATSRFHRHLMYDVGQGLNVKVCRDRCGRIEKAVEMKCAAYYEYSLTLEPYGNFSSDGWGPNCSTLFVC